MDYNHIKSYLDKVKNLIFSKEENIKLISLAIKINTGIDIETKNITTKGICIYIKASPLVRNEIMMSKEKMIKPLIALFISDSKSQQF